MFNKKLLKKMRTKHVLMSLALTAAFAACSNEEIINSESLDKAKNELIELPEGFLLAGTRGGDAITRGAWEYGSATEYALKHAWMPTEVLEGSDYKYIPDMVGLAWTGVNGNVGISAPTDMVHSNYKFTHYAWGVNGVVAEYDKCNKKYQKGVKALTEIADVQAGRDATDGSIYYENTTTTNQITWPSYSIADNVPDITTGFFDTENSTVYAGQYIVYAPFDKENVSNYVTATSKSSFAKTVANIAKDKAFNDLNNEIFMYGQTVIEKGGIQAGAFAAKNLSGFILLKVSGTMNNLRKVMLYDADGKFLTKVGLSAKGIIAGQTGTSLYLSDAMVKKEHSKFISVEFESCVDVTNSAYIAIPVLPTETAIKNLTVVCINEDGMAVDRTISGDMTIPSNGYASVNGGNAQWFEITGINTGEYKVATDASSLETAINTSNNTPANINIMGDITLGKALSITNNYTLGVVKAGKIIIPAGSTQISLTVKGKSTLDVDVDVKENCCSTYPGKLVIEDATISANSTINVFADEDDKTTDNDGQVLFNVSTTDINNTVKGVINNAGNLVIGVDNASKKTTVTLDGGSIVNSGTMTILRSSVSTEGANEYDGNLSLKKGSDAVLTNSGIIYVEGELSNYGSATNTGTIYDRVAAQVTGNRNIEGGGNYICDVNDNGTRFYVAMNERPAVTAVRFVEKTMSYALATLSSQKYYANVEKYIIDASSGVVTFQSTVGTSAAVASKAEGVTKVTIPALEVLSGTLHISEKVKAADDMPLHLTVTGSASIAKSAKMELTDGRNRLEEMFRAGSLTVEKGGELTVDNNINAYIVENVEVKGDKTEKGKILFKNNTITDVHGDFINWGVVTITTGTSAANVAGEVWVNGTDNVKGADTSDKSYYPAGTPVVRP